MVVLTDTHRIINLLEQRGFSKEQAEGVVEVIKEIDVSELASQNSVEKLASKINMLIGINIATFAGVLSMMLNRIF